MWLAGLTLTAHASAGALRRAVSPSEDSAMWSASAHSVSIAAHALSGADLPPPAPDFPALALDPEVIEFEAVGAFEAWDVMECVAAEDAALGCSACGTVGSGAESASGAAASPDAEPAPDGLACGRVSALIAVDSAVAVGATVTWPTATATARMVLCDACGFLCTQVGEMPRRPNHRFTCSPNANLASMKQTDSDAPLTQQ